LIQNSDISIVVQGAVMHGPNWKGEGSMTRDCLLSVRKYFPGSKIILSTWAKADLGDLDYDELVLSEDPGAVSIPHTTIKNNVNRQIKNTIEGLRRVQTKYSLKLRTDFILKGRQIVELFNAYPFPSSLEGDREFDARVVICCYYSRHPEKFDYPMPFHPSDWFHFGLTSDLIRLFDIPFCPEPENVEWWLSRERPLYDPRPSETRRYVPEQHIWLSCLRKRKEIRFDYTWDIRDSQTIPLSARALAANFIIVDPSQVGIFPNGFPIPIEQCFKVYTHYDWLRLNRKHGGANRLQLWDHEIIRYYRYRIKVTINGLRIYLGRFRRWARQLLEGKTTKL